MIVVGYQGYFFPSMEPQDGEHLPNQTSLLVVTVF